jgi:hypothetical protein
MTYIPLFVIAYLPYFSILECVFAPIWIRWSLTWNLPPFCTDIWRTCSNLDNMTKTKWHKYSCKRSITKYHKVKAAFGINAFIKKLIIAKQAFQICCWALTVLVCLPSSARHAEPPVPPTVLPHYAGSKKSPPPVSLAEPRRCRRYLLALQLAAPACPPARLTLPAYPTASSPCRL